MELQALTAVEIGIGIALLIVGVVAGALLGGSRASRARIRTLEAELAQANERLAGYRDQVEKHFSQTSDLFGELTRQYRQVWDHLSEGARELCSDRAAIGRGFGPPLLLDSADDAPTGDDPSQEEEAIPPVAELGATDEGEALAPEEGPKVAAS